MNRKNGLFMGMTVATLAVGAWAADTAGAPKITPTPSPAHRLHRKEILDQLQLTDDQKKKMRQARAAYRKRLAEIDGQLKVKKVELESEMEKSEPDQEKLDLLANKIGDLYGQRLNEKIRAKLELEKKILTAAQVERLRTLLPEDNTTTDTNFSLQD